MAVPLRVAVRIRPSQPHDGQSDGEAAVVPCSERSLRVACDGAPRTLEFDNVFGPETSQREVFTRCCLPLLEAVLEGTNACIFAFGQTGAGKTHSMIGPEGGRRRASQDGVLPQAASELFRRIARVESEAHQAIGAAGFSAYEVRVSFLEVYREYAFDLLAGSVSANRDPSGACAIREQPDPLRVYADGAVEEKVTSAAQLLSLVAKGAANRATAATGVHAHSSRSHALLIIALEHRWRDLDDPDARKVKSQTSRLTLVDLAGAETMERSHGGNVDAAGVGTNLGLLVLGRVIHALAANERVPYRDSTLTRLLQTSLGGRAVTQMLTCVSPAGIDADQSWRTLQYANRARDVRCMPEVARIREELDNDPMRNDHEDEDATLNRRAIWIETREFGDVFARCVGDPSDPLILWVHGSGPKNSSMFWNNVVMDVASLAHGNKLGLPQSFFQVAIDCPGYGQSPGDRQTIRSYPGNFLSSVVEALGRKTAAAICGSSQGAASTFNAALECPKLLLSLAVCHPVGHAPQRYTAIKQPSLLIFDTEDDGHPVSVGRQMRRYLPDNRYFEFSRSKDGDWEAMHMGEELLKMLAGYWKDLSGKRRGGRADPKMPDLTRVAGGFRAWSEQHGDDYLPMGCKEGGWSCAGTELPVLAANPQGNVWRAVLDPMTNVMQYEHTQTGRISKVRPPGAQVLVEPLNQGQLRGKRAPGARRVGGAPEPLFEQSDSGEDEEDRMERERREQQEADEKVETEQSQEDCDLCGGALLDPLRLSKCRCALCACCAEMTVRYMRRCPVCDDTILVKKGNEPQSDAEELSRRLAALETDESSDLGARLRQRREELKQLQSRRRAACRVVLEYGNSAHPAKGKTSYTTFLKVPMMAGGPKDAKSPLAKVDFNINPGYAKPTATVASPDAKTGAQFEYTMARSYPCFITVHFKKEWGLPELTIEYYVQDEPKTSRRIVLDMPTSQLGGKRPGQATFKAYDVIRNGWVQCISGQAPKVEYEEEVLHRMRQASPQPRRQLRASSSELLPQPPTLERSRSDEMKEHFRALNVDGDGMVDAEVFVKVLQGLGGASALTEAEARRLLDAGGVGPDGRISFDRFTEFVYGLRWTPCN
eukprot:TRINITY_DN22014_c0_g1_i1.p1 TRINITY_DN22014_c0_g1~~TRINITY_DN22014_c0_g1_i1.p1  ORF type:complete len:1108 (+),score=144.32 TRINITY_DN22014_c0_g1_i1:47-3370(+)